jgi:hypothetical protein
MAHSGRLQFWQLRDLEKRILRYVRVLLVGMSNMLSSIVAAIAQAPDIVVAGQVSGNEDLAVKIGLTNADALIVQTDQPGAVEQFLPLLGIFPGLKVIAIDRECSSGFLHHLRPNVVRLPELSADLIQSVLRTPLLLPSETDWSKILPLIPGEHRGLG